MPGLLDPEFGKIKLTRSKLNRGVNLKLSSLGQISASTSPRTPLFLVKQLIDDSRPALRQALARIRAQRTPLIEGQLIGRSHNLQFIDSQQYKSQLLQNKLIIHRPIDFEANLLKNTLDSGVHKALKKQASFYLPKKLATTAKNFGFEYQKVGFSNAQTRWGSCSSAGLIKLNIWLMILPDELIDYVIVHELCHTRHLNHGVDFWQTVSSICPNHKQLRLTLKNYQPGRI